jgi:hypothetical protein
VKLTHSRSYLQPTDQVLVMESVDLSSGSGSGGSEVPDAIEVQLLKDTSVGTKRKRDAESEGIGTTTMTRSRSAQKTPWGEYFERLEEITLSKNVGKPWNIIVLVNRTPRPRHLQGAIIKYTNSLFQHPPLIEACRCQSRDQC